MIEKISHINSGSVNPYLYANAKEQKIVIFRGDRWSLINFSNYKYAKKMLFNFEEVKDCDVPPDVLAFLSPNYEDAETRLCFLLENHNAAGYNVT